MSHQNEEIEELQVHSLEMEQLAGRYADESHAKSAVIAALKDMLLRTRAACIVTCDFNLCAATATKFTGLGDSMQYSCDAHVDDMLRYVGECDRCDRNIAFGLNQSAVLFETLPEGA